MGIRNNRKHNLIFIAVLMTTIFGLSGCSENSSEIHSATMIEAPVVDNFDWSSLETTDASDLFSQAGIMPEDLSNLLEEDTFATSDAFDLGTSSIAEYQAIEEESVELELEQGMSPETGGNANLGTAQIVPIIEDLQEPEKETEVIEEVTPEPEPIMRDELQLAKTNDTFSWILMSAIVVVILIVLYAYFHMNLRKRGNSR